MDKRAQLLLANNHRENAVLMGTFKRFLEDQKGLKLLMLLRGKQDGQLKRVEFEILNRWKKEYKNRVLAHFYKLNEWAESNLQAAGVTMVTFTTYQTGFSVSQQFEHLKANYRKLRDNMRKELGKFQYVWVTEPHKTGYAHIHMLAFCEISQAQQEKFKRLWSEKYSAGDYEHGLNFSDYISKENLRSVKNYLMKYVTKSLEDFADLGTRIYNAVAWNMSRRSNTESTGFRFYGMSRDLTQACKLDKSDEQKYECLSMNIVRPERRISFPNKYFNDRGYKIWFVMPSQKVNIYRTGDIERLQTAYNTLSFDLTV